MSQQWIKIISSGMVMIGKKADISELNSMIDHEHGGATRYQVQPVRLHV